MRHLKGKCPLPHNFGRSQVATCGTEKNCNDSRMEYEQNAGQLASGSLFGNQTISPRGKNMGTRGPSSHHHGTNRFSINKRCLRGRGCGLRAFDWVWRQGVLRRRFPTWSWRRAIDDDAAIIAVVVNPLDCHTCAIIRLLLAIRDFDGEFARVPVVCERT